MKTNIPRIAHKIQEFDTEPEFIKSPYVDTIFKPSPFRVTDMMRGGVVIRLHAHAIPSHPQAEARGPGGRRVPKSQFDDVRGTYIVTGV